MSSNTLLNFDINYEDIIRTTPEEALEQVHHIVSVCTIKRK